MTQEEKQLLLKDLCERLPYRPKGIKLNGLFDPKDITIIGYTGRFVETVDDEIEVEQVRLYLRSMSSMTKEEEVDFTFIWEDILSVGKDDDTCILSVGQIDWLNAHYFDYRGLISKGLAIEAPERMYKVE